MPSRDERARADHGCPWTECAPAEDMTGGHLDREDPARPMRSPTMAAAAAVYERRIECGFDKGPHTNERELRGLDRRVPHDPRLAAVTDR